MNGFEYDRECTAAPGVMGEDACQLYPGCGCGKSRETGPEGRNVTPLEVERFFNAPEALITEIIMDAPKYRDHGPQHGPGVWTCADGRQIKYEDMQDSHLVRAFKINFERWGWTSHHTTPMLLELLSRAKAKG